MNGSKFTIKEVREMSGLTQREFSEIAEMSVNTYIFKERKNKFYLSEVALICEKIGISIEVINPVEIERRKANKDEF